MTNAHPWRGRGPPIDQAAQLGPIDLDSERARRYVTKPAPRSSRCRVTATSPRPSASDSGAKETGVVANPAQGIIFD